MPTGANAIASLPLLTWRDLDAPCDAAPFDCSHDQAPRAYPYVDAEGHDHTGRKSYITRVHLYFLETVEPSSFTDKWPLWRTALEDGRAGLLTHPLLGSFNARVLEWHGELVARVLSGIVVDVTFTESLVDPAEDSLFVESVVSLSKAAEAAKTACDTISIAYPDKTTDLFTAIKQIEGFAFSATLSMAGALNQVLGKVEFMIETVALLNDPKAWPAYDTLLQVWSGLKDLKRRTDRALSRKTATFILTAPVTLDGFAKLVGNTVDDVMGLNLAALGKPIIPAGTSLLYYP